MRKLIASSFMTLDGVSEDPAGFEGTAFGGWSLPFFDEEASALALEGLKDCDLFLCGRLTYEGFATYGPQMAGDYAERLNALPKAVVSSTLKEPLDWNARVLGGDPAAAVRELKELPGGDIVTYGAGRLLAALLEADLVDTVKVQVFPLLLARGRKLFGAGVPPRSLELGSVLRLGSGVVAMTYDRKD